jgi:hypothetical protein
MLLIGEKKHRLDPAAAAGPRLHFMHVPRGELT